MASFPEGLSILIPVFNFNVVKLTEDLLSQSKLICINFEVICIDDRSEEHFRTKNRGLKNYPHVQYIELEKNAGRSAIRNILSEKAKFRYLLYLDCDTGIMNTRFLSTYLKYSSHPVIIGGRQYAAHPPELPFLLHWTVGSAREVNTAKERSVKPYQSLMFNNIFIHKNIFDSISLDENIKTYGHEDTKFGNILESSNIEILHIDNPTLHIGLDSADYFLKKTVEGVINLYTLTRNGYGIQSTLYKLFTLLKKIKCLSLFYFVCSHFLAFIQKQLTGKKPSLILFDIYKLFYFTKHHLKK